MAMACLIVLFLDILFSDVSLVAGLFFLRHLNNMQVNLEADYSIHIEYQDWSTLQNAPYQVELHKYTLVAHPLADFAVDTIHQ